MDELLAKGKLPERGCSAAEGCWEAGRPAQPRVNITLVQNSSSGEIAKGKALWMFPFAAAAYNLVRMRNLRASQSVA